MGDLDVLALDHAHEALELHTAVFEHDAAEIHIVRFDVQYPALARIEHLAAVRGRAERRGVLGLKIQRTVLRRPVQEEIIEEGPEHEGPLHTGERRELLGRRRVQTENERVFKGAQVRDIGLQPLEV